MFQHVCFDHMCSFGVFACLGLRTLLIWVFRAFLRRSLTFFAHSHTETLLQTAVLTLVAVMLVDLTFSVGSAQRKRNRFTNRAVYIFTPPSVTPVMSELRELVGLKSYQGCDLCKSLALHAPALPFTAGRGLPTFHREHFHGLKKTLSKQPRLFIM